MQLPLAVLASGPAIALFPTLSMLSAEGKIDELRIALASALRRTLLLTLFATALLMALSVPVIQVLLEGGEFSHADTLFTARVLVCYSLGIVGLGVQQMLARGFYAMQETRAPVVAGIVAMILFFALGAFLTFGLGLGASGLALAASVATTALGGWLWFGLRRKFGRWDEGATLQLLWKGSLAAVVAYVVAIAINYSLSTVANGFSGATKYSVIFATVTFASLGALAAFVATASVLRVKEVGFITAKLKRRK
jgi:putative peptidoglycan lipid II flippase